MVEQSDKCPGCGTQSYEADDVSVAQLTCRVCKELELGKARVYEHKPPKKPGLKFYVKRGERGR